MKLIPTKLKRQIEVQVTQIYNEFGQASAFDWIKTFNESHVVKVPYEQCKACDTSSPSIDHACLICGQETKAVYQLMSNQYIPRKSRSLPSGMPACATYYYLINSYDEVVDFTTLKPYRGKQMERYAMHSLCQAEAYLEVINNR